MSTTIDYKQTDLRTISAVENINIYDARTGAYVTKEVTRFTDSAYGTGTAQDIKLHAYQYTANGKVQTVSMSQLFMTICMNRANDLEAETVKIMDEMSQNTTKINELADLEDIYLNGTKSNQYNVWCSMHFGDNLSTIPVCELAEEVDLTLPSCFPNYPTETHKDISASEFEEYKAFFSELIEKNRTLLATDPTYGTEEGKKGKQFAAEVGRHQENIGASTLTEAFNDLFGASASDFTTCKWYNNTDTLTPTTSSEYGQLGITEGYQVGDKFFKTLEEVYAYAKSEYGIDMSKDQSTVTSAIESKLDEYNSISQEQMIELQSLVSKRDQAYTLISNALKSMYNSNLSAANNF